MISYHWSIIVSSSANFYSRELYLESDISSLTIILESIQQIQNIYGNFGKIYSTGLFSTKICDMLMSESSVHGNIVIHNKLYTKESNVLVLIDRESDYLDSFLTNFTYESLLHKVKLSFI